MTREKNNKYLSADLSSRFRFVSSVSLILVVFIHAKFIWSNWSNAVNETTLMGQISWYVQFAISENIARVAVPMFFFISGYFICQHYDGTLRSYAHKLKKRFWSLVIPYLCFCILWAVPYAITNPSILSFKLLIDPVPYQFWFLQHLMVLTLLFGTIYWVRKFQWYVLALLFLLFIVSSQRWGGFEESLLFYTMGIYSSEVKSYNNKLLISFSIVFFIVCFALKLWVTNQRVLLICHHFMIFVGAMAIIVWIFSSQRTVKTIIPAGLAFLIFACHEPVLGVMKTFGLRQGWGYFDGLFLYFILPITIILLCCISYFIMKKWSPKLLAFLTGGRL